VSEYNRLPFHGEVWWVDLDPIRGHEQGRRRPCLVISVDEFNQIRHGLVWVVPITGSRREHSFTVALSPPEGGLSKRSMALCHHLRTISVERLDSKIGVVSNHVLTEILTRVRLILGI
jgi:mRNA interferase MazF